MNSRVERPSGALLATISNTVVKVHADHLGRGPTKARTYMNDNVVTCLLEDTLTRSEQTLLQAGDSGGVLKIRALLQATMHDALIAAIRGATGREVKALINGNHVGPDFIAYVFILSEIPAFSAESARA